MAGGDNPTTSVQLLYTNGTWRCSLPDLPAARQYPSQNGLITCGGGYGDDTMTSCVTFNKGSWVETHNLTNKRERHTSWASPEGILLMGGLHANAKTTTELLTEDGDTRPGFTLNYETE